jgi:hypothetical protein
VANKVVKTSKGTKATLSANTILHAPDKDGKNKPKNNLAQRNKLMIQQ